MVAPGKGIVEERYVECIDFNCDINCVHNSTDITWISSQLMPNSKVKLRDKVVLRDSGALPTQVRKYCMASRSSEPCIAAIFEIRILWIKKRHSAIVLIPERGILHSETHTRPPVYYEMKKLCRGECFALC